MVDICLTLSLAFIFYFFNHCYTGLIKGSILENSVSFPFFTRGNRGSDLPGARQPTCGVKGHRQPLPQHLVGFCGNTKWTQPGAASRKLVQRETAVTRGQSDKQSQKLRGEGLRLGGQGKVLGGGLEIKETGAMEQRLGSTESVN